MSVVARQIAPGIAALPQAAPDDARARGHAARSTFDASALFRAARLVLATGVGLGLLSLLVCSLFSRYTSHAFQMADLLHQDGFLGGQAAWYTQWTGRFASNFTWLAAIAAGPSAVRVLPTVYTVAFGAALWFALPRAAALGGRRLDGVNRLLAVEVVLFATLAITPALWFDLYKLTGLITYMTPLVLGTAALAVALRAIDSGRPDRRGMILLGLLTAVAAGYSDTFAGLQPVLVAGLALCALRLRRSRRRTAMRCGIVAAGGTAVGLVALMAAPGNAVRRSLYPPPPHLTTAIGWSIRDAWGFLTGPVAHSGVALPLVAGAFLVLGLSAGAPGRGLTWRRALVAIGGLCVVLVTTHLPAEQMTSQPPPARSEVIPTYALVLVVALLAWWSGVSLAGARRTAAWNLRLSGAAVLVLLAAVPALTLVEVAQSWHAMSAYAAAEDRQWQLAESAAPHSDVVVPQVTSTGIGPLSHDSLQELQSRPGYWTNQAFAEYFGLRSVRVATSSR
jgi:hypothetical protein